MAIDVDKKAKRCCAVERNRLSAQLDHCDSAKSSRGSRRRCYRDAARRSGQRARACIVGG
jgi:hypothetical protein